MVWLSAIAMLSVCHSSALSASPLAIPPPPPTNTPHHSSLTFSLSALLMRAPVGMTQMHSITTDSQKLLDKLERKDKRRGARTKAVDADLEWLMANGLDAVVEAELLAVTGGGGNLVFADGTEFRIGDGGGGAWTRGALPAGTTRRCSAFCETGPSLL
jgi:hypothetical protein